MLTNLPFAITEVQILKRKIINMKHEKTMLCIQGHKNLYYFYKNISNQLQKVFLLNIPVQKKCVYSFLLLALQIKRLFYLH